MKNKVHDTMHSDYTDILVKKQMVWWKRLLDVQAPYRKHFRNKCKDINF